MVCPARLSYAVKYEDYLTFSTEFPTPMKVNKTRKNDKTVYIIFNRFIVILNIFAVDAGGQGIVK